SMPDLAGPTFVSSSPKDGAVEVSTAASFRLTFSEAIDPLSLIDDTILITPSPGAGTGYWSNGGTTINFEPDAPLADDTQYLIVLPEGALRDLAGNRLAESVTIQFTTGPGFASGTFSGVVDGDPLSNDARDPEGAVIVAPTSSPFVDGEDDDGLPVYGADFVGPGGAYSLVRLPDNWYFPFSILDSNGDGRLEPDLGDAVGAYGVDIRMMDTEYDSVQITGGDALTDINFKLFDPMAITGRVAYTGYMVSQEELLTILYSVVFFDTTGFDPASGFSSPSFYVADRSVIFDSDWSISEMGGFPPPVAGTYWVAAYMEIDGFAGYDPDTEPAGVYMNTATEEWIPVTIENGTDALDLSIYMIDPPGGSNLPAFDLPGARDAKVPESVRRIRQLREWMRNAVEARRASR
ncbi:MAG: Ig-like domain-containing protein, partial [bacterium]